MQNENILDQEETITADSYINASRMKRLLNNIIDTIIFYILYIAAIYTAAMIRLISSEESFMIYVIAFSVMLAYYTFLEGTTSRTIGKMITGTIVIKEDGSKITFKDAFLRSLCRLIPFEGFTFLNAEPQGLHDSITKTRVVNKIVG